MTLHLSLWAADEDIFYRKLRFELDPTLGNLETSILLMTSFGFR